MLGVNAATASGGAFIIQVDGSIKTDSIHAMLDVVYVQASVLTKYDLVGHDG